MWLYLEELTTWVSAVYLLNLFVLCQLENYSNGIARALVERKFDFD